ncbi:MAG: SBBP repeat-containing protein [Acidobacteria bacterium]|nr:SBBP repeat-containing protein [Acidobacteriota bacterium]
MRTPPWLVVVVLVAGASAQMRLPLGFEANRGQAGDQARFLARGPGYTLLLAPGETVLAAGDAVVRMRLVGANPAPPMTGLDPLPRQSHYFLGNNPKRWRTHIPNYARVRYEGVYPGVDLVYYGQDRELEYDLVIAPGADPGVIRLAFDGVRRLRLDVAGDLVLETARGELRQRRPAVYQEIAGVRQSVSGRYVLRGRRQVGFAVGVYDRSRPLILDPILRFASYLGGSGDDIGTGIAVDSSGSIYVVGTTTSLNFVTSTGPQPAPGGAKDVFVTKLSNSGAGVGYSTYLGGSGDDTGASIAVDAFGSAYVTGTTASPNFPTTAGSLRSTPAGGADAFVARLDPNGATLVYSTYLGGSGDDSATSIAIDSTGSAYVTGATASANFPVSAGAFRNFLGGSTDAYVAKLNPSGSALTYGTYLGGADIDQAFGIAVDSAGNAYVTGTTFSTNFPVANPAQPACAASQTPFGNPCTDAFVTKLNPAGSTLVYSTYFGGSGLDIGRAIAVDAAGNAYVAGVTNSQNLPVRPGAFQPALRGGPQDAFVTKFNPGGTPIYSTYLGGDGDDFAYGIGVDTGGNAYVAGSTSSTNFLTFNPLQTSCAVVGGSLCADAFLTKLNAAGSLVYSTYFGGTASDRALALAIDPSGAAYLTGETFSSNFPVTAGAFQTLPGGASDAFVVRITDGGPFTLVISALSPSSAAAGSPGFSLAVSGANFTPGSVVRWNGLDRATSFVSDSVLVALIPSSDIAFAGAAQVTVFSPLGGLSNALPFTITSGGNPIPVVNAILPASVPAGAPGFTLTIFGSGLLAVSVARWNGSDRPTTFLNNGRLQVAILASDLATGGAFPITVFTPGPGGGVSNCLLFTVQNPVAVVASLSPASATAGGAGFVLTVNGSSFVSTSVVRWNGDARLTTFVSSTQLRAFIPASDIAAPGAAQVTVLNPAPGGGSSGALAFSIAGPVISLGGTVNAASFSTQPLAAGTIAALFGTNLAASTAQATTTPLPLNLAGVTLRLDGLAVPLFFVSPTQINFLAPWELQGRTQAALTVESTAVTSAPQTVSLALFGPALFAVNQQGSGQGAILISGTTSVAAPAGTLPGSRPVRRGEFLEIYAIGLGPVANQPASGAPAPASPLATTNTTPVVTIGGVSATVIYSGLAAGFVGLYQVNVQAPDIVPPGGAVPVSLSIGGFNSNTVTIAVQ